MKRSALLVLVLVAAACRTAPPARTPAPPTRPVGRQPIPPARAVPQGAGVLVLSQRTGMATGQDAEALYWRAVQAWHVDNDAARAAVLVESALRAQPAHARALLLRCALGAADRRYAAFVEQCAATVEVAWGSWVAEAALVYADQARGQHPDHDARVATAALQALDSCTRGTGARCAALGARGLRAALGVAAARRDVAWWQSLAARAGVVTAWTVAGPYGPAEVDAFRGLAGFALAGIPPEPVHAGVRTAAFHRVARQVSDGALQPARLASPGLYAAESWVHLPRPARVLVEVRSAVSFRVALDGAVVLTHDEWADPPRPRATATVVMAPGWHRVGLEVSARGVDRVDVRLISDDGRAPLDQQFAALPEGSFPSPAAVPAPGLADLETEAEALFRASPDDVEAALAAVAAHAANGDAARARRLAEDVVEAFPASARALQMLSTVVEDDQALPAAVRQSLARAHCEKALAVDPRVLICRYRLAVLDQARRPEDTLRALTALVTDRPDYPHAWRSLMEVYRALGWNAEAAAAADRALALGAVDGVVDPAAAFFQSLGEGARARALRLRSALVDREPFSPRLAEWLADGLDDEAALKEWDRLLRVFPDHPDQVDRLALVRRSRDARTYHKALEAHVARFPADGDGILQWCTLSRSLGDARALRTCLERADAVVPSSSLLYRLREETAGREVGDDPALPVREVRSLVEELEAARRAGAPWLGDAATVVLVDHGRRVLARDGGGYSAKHRVVRIGTRDAADAMGEIRAGNDEEWRVLRVLKADGRVLEPEVGQGKGDVSLSGLEPGDTVEMRSVTLGRPPPVDGRFWEWFLLGDRYPVLHAEYVLDVPAALMSSLRIAERGVAAPRVVTLDGVVRHAWALDQVPARVPEPFSPNAAEYQPRVLVALGPDDGPDARTVCRRLAGTARTGRTLGDWNAHVARAGGGPDVILERVLDEVRARVEPAAGPWEAESAAALGRGMHLPLARALLRANGVPARAVVARGALAAEAGLAVPGDHDVLLLVVPLPSGDRVFTQLGGRLVDGAPPWLVTGSALEADCDEMARLGRRYDPPAVPADAWEHQVRVDATVTAAGLLSGTVRAQVAEPAAGSLREELRRATPSQVEAWLSSLLQAHFPGVQLVSTVTSDPGARAGPLELELRFQSTDTVRRSPLGAWTWDRFLEQPLLDDALGGSTPESYLRVSARKTPLVLGRPYRERTVVHLDLPAGATGVVVPRALEARGRGFLVKQDAVVQPGAVTITRVTHVEPERISVEDFPAWRAQVEQLVRDGRNALEYRLAEPPP
ncbi:MAG: DUF3857 domain-containing protein [Deltaproteobacteria bacterium]|nr:DUF3857 domain-containing protein [Deltaproteobacteria bacterium]